MNLALKIVEDGEGATKFVTVRVRGARTDADADIAARAVANSLLVKTSWVGEYPNWGRVMDALGYSGAKVDEERVDIRYDDLLAAKNGVVAGTPLDDLKRILRQKAFTLDIDLHLGKARRWSTPATAPRNTSGSTCRLISIVLRSLSDTSRSTISHAESH